MFTDEELERLGDTINYRLELMDVQLEDEGMDPKEREKMSHLYRELSLLYTKIEGLLDY